MKKCVTCGAELMDNATFCNHCGAPQPGQSAGSNSGSTTNATSGSGSGAGTGYGAGFQQSGSWNAQGNGQQNWGNQQQNWGNQQNSSYESYVGGKYSGPNGGMAIVSYITWIGFLIAVLAGDQRDPFVRFHENQALVLNLFSLVGGIVGGLLCFIPILGALITGIISLFFFILFIMGIINAAQGDFKELPVIGSVRILK